MVTSSSPPKMNFIVLGQSHFCEKARWGLDRSSVVYKESKHAAVLHMLFTRGLGARTTVPKLVVGKSSNHVVLQESSDILRFVDKNIRREEDRLYPSDPEALKSVQSWEVKLDKKLGPNVRQWGYFHTIFGKFSYDLMTKGAPFLERAIAWIFMPLIRRMVWIKSECGKPGAKENSLKAVKEVFQEVEAALADGRPFICGERFTAADLTFAALAAPIVKPSNYGPWTPQFDELPKEQRDTILEMRKTPAGQHALKMFETERKKIVA